MALTIRRAQRDVLRQQVVTELTGIRDIYLAVQADQWATALKLLERHEYLVRLLDDLGRRADDPAEELAPTTEPARLLRYLARLHERAGETIEQYVGAVEAVAERGERVARVVGRLARGAQSQA